VSWDLRCGVWEIRARPWLPLLVDQVGRIRGETMGDDVEFALLGPLEVRINGQPVSIPAAKHRVVLATLLMRANEVVPADTIAERLWGRNPPAAGRKTVQGYVARLRKKLGSEVILTRPSGYIAVVAPGCLDLHQFEEMVAEANLAAEDVARRSALLSSALALWRGEPLADIHSEQVRSLDVTRLVERRLYVLGQRIDADLALGRHAELISELRELTTLHPLNEEFAAQLVLALHKSGRRAHALETYRRTRQVLVDEIGVEPSARLHNVHQQVLAADPDAVVAAEPVPAAWSAGILPAQLPPDISDFVGCQREISLSSEYLTVNGVNRHGSASVVCLVGQGGIGKTTLAVHVGHLLRREFTDGQLYANLCDAGGNPLDQGDILAGFLRALGIDDSVLPTPIEERSALLRSVVAGRRVLFLLDNVSNESQVRRLLPGGAGTAAIVTSRRMLSGLDGARHIQLRLLRTNDAVELLARITGRDKVGAEVDRAREIALRCGRLPLAVRIAGARLVAHPYRTLAWLAGRLANERSRLNELVVGDLAVRANIGLSYRGLDSVARRAFRLLSTLTVDTFTACMAGAMLDVDAEAAQDVLDALVDHHVLDVVSPHDGGQVRYRFHDLVRIFARERAEAEETAPDRRQALGGVFERGCVSVAATVCPLRLTPITAPPSGLTSVATTVH